MPKGRRFKPGVSGNPGGRPKGLMAYIQSQTRGGLEIVDVVLGVMRTASRVGLKLAAASWLADRGFGKPVQAMEHTGEDGGPMVITLKWPDES